MYQLTDPYFSIPTLGILRRGPGGYRELNIRTGKLRRPMQRKQKLRVLDLATIDRAGLYDDDGMDVERWMIPFFGFWTFFDVFEHWLVLGRIPVVWR